MPVCLGVYSDNRGLLLMLEPKRESVLEAKDMSEESRCSGIDLAWDDSHVMPEVITPEVEFMFRKMTEVFFSEIGAKPGVLVLDVGCGRGLDGVRMSQEGASVIGVEPSDIMLRHARDYMRESGTSIALVRAIGEYLPFRSACVDKVVCKGALDHFADPARVLEEMARVLKVGGRAVIVVANFESLGFKIGRAVYSLWKSLSTERVSFKMPWEIPDDHTYRFDYRLLKRMVSQCFTVEKVKGISLLFGLPWWGAFLSRCPAKLAQTILALLDKIARRLPWLSDVVLVSCTRRT